MRIEPIEIYSDTTNAAVMRHPGRRFPGVLIQGDTLHGLCTQADLVCREMDSSSLAFEEMDDLRTRLWEFLNHYKAALGRHDIPLPFQETRVDRGDRDERPRSGIRCRPEAG